MNPPTTRTLGPARIVALLLVALTVFGLGWLHFSSGSDPVSVPSRAHGGQLVMHPGTYETDEGSYDADRGTLVVPENRADTNSRLIALPVVRIHARSANPGEPIFRLEGGPGITNMSFTKASRFAENHDVVLVGYRGVDGSSKLDCPEVGSSRAHARDFLSEDSARSDAAAFEACATRLTAGGVDLAGYSLPQRADDLDAARQALGYDQIDLLSESAGTRTALIYGWRYPERIHRSVMIGVNPPGGFLWDAKTTGEQVDRYAALCADDAACRSRTPDLAGSLRLANDNIPSRFWFLPVAKGDAQVASFFGLMNATADGGGPLSGPLTIDTLLAAGQGDGGGAWLLATMAQLVFPDVQVWGDVASVARSDAAHARRFFASGANRGSVIGSPATDFIWAGGRLLDAWPANPDEDEYATVRDSKVETLMVSGALDFATPPQKAARELLPHMANARQVVLPNMGHTDDFWAVQPEAGTRLVTTYLDTGRVDTYGYADEPVDFSPSFRHAWIANIVLGSLLGLAALAVLGLLWMPIRVHRRDAFGRKSSAVLRSLYAILLGFGGWAAGLLIVLAAFPTVALDDELVAALSIGLPVGLGLYFAWVHRDWSSRTKVIGVAASVGGALVGAWLGFNALDSLVGALTAIFGAVAGGNVALIALDVAWDRQRHSRAAEEPIAARPGWVGIA